LSLEANPRDLPQRQAIGDRTRLRRLCLGLGRPDLAHRLQEVLDVVLGPPSERSGGRVLSVGVTFERGGPGLSLLVDPGQGASSEEAWQTGLDLSRRLTRGLGVDPWPLREVQHLFQPAPSIPTAFALRYRVLIQPKGDTVVAAVLNPNVMGRDGAGQLVARACQLLGASSAVGDLVSHELGAEHVAVDLAPPPIARIEVGAAENWFIHQRADRPFAGATPFTAGQIADWLAVLAASGVRGRVKVRTRLSVNRDGEALRAFLRLPVGRHSESDAAALEQLAGYLPVDDLTRLEGGLTALSQGPLEQTRGSIGWVAFSTGDPARSLAEVELSVPDPSK